MKTYIAKEKEINSCKEWYVIDAEGQTLGRLASQIAHILKGKHKPIYAPHYDVGDFVVVVNAAKIHLTGNKMGQKSYFRHSGYPGGEKYTSVAVMLQRHPERVLQFAVKGMLPKNSLGRQMISKLKIYADGTHPHMAQQPKELKLAN